MIQHWYENRFIMQFLIDRLKLKCVSNKLCNICRHTSALIFNHSKFIIHIIHNIQKRSVSHPLTQRRSKSCGTASDFLCWGLILCSRARRSWTDAGGPSEPPRYRCLRCMRWCGGRYPSSSPVNKDQESANEKSVSINPAPCSLMSTFFFLKGQIAFLWNSKVGRRKIVLGIDTVQI